MKPDFLLAGMCILSYAITQNDRGGDTKKPNYYANGGAGEQP